MVFQRDYIIKKKSSTERNTSGSNFKYVFQNMDNTLITDKNWFNHLKKNTFYLVVYWEIVPNYWYSVPKLLLSAPQIANT